MGIIDDARDIVKERANDYGNVVDSFARIAAFWSEYLGVDINKYDVAKMMILLKISRSKTSDKIDNMIDIVGYVECIDQMLQRDDRFQ